MEWQKVESSQIAEVGFAEPDTLGMRFLKKDGSISEYTYAGVPFRMYRAMLAAKSVGIYFKENIKDKKDEAGDLLYPYTKVEAENPLQPPSSPNGGGKKTGSEALSQSKTADGVDADPAGTALAKVDDLKPEWVFVPGNMDTLLRDIREQALAEVKGLNISTPKMRKQFKDTKNKVVKSRTYIEKMRVSYVSAEKKRLATVDTESRRIQDILRGIEDEVAAPLTAWETKEEERIQGHNDAIAAIREDPGYGLQETVAELEKRIEWLGQYRGSRDWQEFQVVAEKTIEEEVDRTQLLLEKATVRERERLELEALRAAEAQRRENERIAAAAEELAAKQVQAAVEAARVETRQEVIAELATKPLMVHVSEVGTYPTIEDLPISTDTAPDDTFFVHVSIPTESHAEKIEGEVVKAIMENGFPAHVAANLVAVIAKGLIPHVSITY